MLKIADTTFTSRLFTGTGKFATPALMLEALRGGNDAILAPLQQLGVHLPPNTSGAKTAAEAVFAARLAREALGTHWVKLEIHPDVKYLLPDAIETLKAAETLVKDGFVVLPYCGADPVLCKRLEEVGCASVMPLSAPIGSNRGQRTRDFLEIIIEQARVQIVIDAGIGAPSHALAAMELGADARLVNTAIAVARETVQMALAFRLALDAGELARQAGLGSSQRHAVASSPLTAFFSQSEETP